MNRPAIDRVGLQLTTDCDFECLHCLSSSGPSKGASLGLDTMKTCIDAISGVGVPSVGFTGGEALRHSGLLFNSLRRAAKRGLRTGLATNGGWSRNGRVREYVLDRLAALNLGVLGISLDVFHRPFLDEGYIRTLVSGAQQRGIRATLLTTLSRHPDNLGILSLASSLETGILLTNISPVGRALSLDPRHFIRLSSRIGKCFQARSPIVLVDGTVAFCCGITGTEPALGILGNIHDNDLATLLTRKKLPLRAVFAQHRLDELLAASGLEERGVKPSDFRSACDLCMSMLREGKVVHRLERLALTGASSPQDDKTFLDSDRAFPAGLKGKRLAIRPSSRLIRGVRIVNWPGILDRQPGMWNIFSSFDRDGYLSYQIVGDDVAVLVQRLLDGDTCTLLDPADIPDGDPAKFVGECLDRWMIFNLYRLGVLQEVA